MTTSETATPQMTRTARRRAMARVGAGAGGAGMSPLAIEAGLLALSIITAWFLSATFVNPAWSLVALVNFIWMATLLFRIEPRATVLLLPELVLRFSAVFAIIFVEYGNPMPEVATVGTAGPYSSAFIFYLMILFASYTMAFRLFAGRPGRLGDGPLTTSFVRYANAIAAAVLVVVGFLILWLIIRGLINGFPLLAGIDRFVYRRMLGDKVTLYALNMKFIILFVMGIVAFRLPASYFLRGATVLAAMLMLAIYFLFADKFFTQLVAFCGFVAPYMYSHYEKVRRYIVLYALGAGLVLGVVGSMTWYIYSNQGQLTRAATMERLGGRIVAQSELWYIQAHVGAPLLQWDENFVRRNISALSVKEIDLYAVQESIGPNYFSNRYAPDEIRASIQRNAGSVTFTSALEPLGLMAFGWIGLAGLMVLVGIMVALSAWYIAYAITSRSIISAIFAGSIAVMVRTAITQGAPWVLIGLYNLKLFAFIALVEIGTAAIWASQKGPRAMRARQAPREMTGRSPAA